MDNEDKRVLEIMLEAKKALSDKDSDKLESLAIEVIKLKTCYFIEDIFPLSGIGKSTFYKWDMHEKHSIKSALAHNSMLEVGNIRKKWQKDEKGSILLYKLICTDEDRAKLDNRPVIQQQATPEAQVIHVVTTDANTEALRQKILELEIELEEAKNKKN